jgi:arylsulfatase A-like enzyme
LATVLWAFLPSPIDAAGARASRPPNVILFLSDDHGWRDLGSYGATDLYTPNLDRLAAEGVRFTQFYAAAPLCSPSRAALLTGRWPIRAGVPTNVGSHPHVGDKSGMPSDEVTLAELLRQHSYRTGMVGKWHLGTGEGMRPNDQGFDEFFGFHAGCVDYWSHFFYWGEPHYHDLWRNRTEVFEDGHYLTALLTREAVRFIDSSRDQPFFLYVPYSAPHYPMQAPRRYFERFANVPEPRRPYAAILAALDESAGTILAHLDELGLADDTLVVFLSDHGSTAELRAGGGGGDNGPFRGHKFSLFDGGLRVPCIVRWPGRVPRGEVREQMAANIDIFATVAAAAGVPLPADRTIDGRNLLPILAPNGATLPSAHDALYFEWREQKAVRRGDWKLVVRGREDDGSTLAGDDEILLSDLSRDPGETTNLRKEHPEIVDELLELHDRWAADVGAERAASK